MKNDAGLTASFLFEPRLNEKPGHTERHQKIGNDPRDSARFSHRRQNHSARERPEPVNFWHTLTPLPLASTSATRLRSSSERALQQQLAIHYNISGDTGTLVRVRFNVRGRGRTPPIRFKSSKRRTTGPRHNLLPIRKAPQTWRFR